MNGTASPPLLAPASTAAVVLGAHDWTEAGLENAPSFLRSASYIIAHLYDRAGLGLDPDLILNLFDDTAEAGGQLARVRDTLETRLQERHEVERPVTDVLVYYVGHGFTDDQGHLSLLVRRSRRGLETQTAIKATDLASTLRLAAPQQRRIVILDCCFSEAAAKAFIGMGDLNQQVAAVAVKDFTDDNPKRGTLLLCSCPVGQVSIGAPKAQRTLFTGAVLEVLQRGAEGRPPYLSFADLRDAAFDRMVESFGAKTPRPVLHQANAKAGDLTRVPAFPNRAIANRDAKGTRRAQPITIPRTRSALQPSASPQRFEHARWLEKLRFLAEPDDPNKSERENWRLELQVAEKAVAGEKSNAKLGDMPSLLSGEEEEHETLSERYLLSLENRGAACISTKGLITAWQRCFRAAKNCFDGKLYNDGGIEFFKEAAKLYQNEKEFRVIARRYIEEFERVLEAAVREDPSFAHIARSLGSNSGKVYTLLVHATGRFS